MPKPKLPVDLTKDGHTRTATTAAEYVALTYRGYQAPSEEDLTPQQKAARTRAENKARGEQETSNDATSTLVPAGDAV